MENSGLVIQLLTEIKSEIAGASGFKFSNIIVALIVAFSTLLGILIQALIQNAISKRRSQEDYTKLVVQFRADIVKEELSLIRACASELLADFDVV